MADLDDVVTLAVDENPAELADTVKDILGAKTLDVINNKRKEIAADYFDGAKDTNDDDSE